MLKKLIVALIGLFLLATVFVCGVVIGSLDQRNYDQKFQETKAVSLNSEVLWNNIQTWRESQGKSKYIKSDLLCDLAKIRVYEIRTDFSHDGFSRRYDGDVVWSDKRIKQIGENIGTELTSESAALNAWLLSPTHRAILDKNYVYSCVIADGKNAVQIFANF